MLQCIYLRIYNENNHQFNFVTKIIIRVDSMFQLTRIQFWISRIRKQTIDKVCSDGGRVMVSHLGRLTLSR